MLRAKEVSLAGGNEGEADGWVEGRMDVYVRKDVRTYVWMDGWKDRCICMEGWMMDGWMDVQMDGIFSRIPVSIASLH